MFTKREILTELLNRGSVLVYCDGRHCNVPAPHSENRQLILRFGWRLNPPVHDLSLASDGLYGTLLFGAQRFYCRLPWERVFAANVEGEDSFVTWPKDYPSTDAVGAVTATTVGPEDTPPAPPRARHLRLVGEDEGTGT